MASFNVSSESSGCANLTQLLQAFIALQQQQNTTTTPTPKVIYTSKDG